MSDLLPLIAAALNDKVAEDALKEINDLKQQLKIATSVEILKYNEEDDTVMPTVQASGQFQDGNYAHNPNLWQVELLPSSTLTTCRLADLGKCRVCVGGGFPVAKLDTENFNSLCSGWLDPGEHHDTETSKAVSFCIGGTWLKIVVHGWPRTAWEAVIQEDNLDARDMASFLVETIATEFPDATVTFVYISLLVSNISGALLRLLPPSRTREVEEELDARNTEDNVAYSRLSGHVTMTIRNLGNVEGSALFIPKVNDVMAVLARLGIHGLTEEDIDPELAEEIQTVIERVERSGAAAGQARVDDVFF